MTSYLDCYILLLKITNILVDTLQSHICHKILYTVLVDNQLYVGITVFSTFGQRELVAIQVFTCCGWMDLSTFNLECLKLETYFYNDSSLALQNWCTIFFKLPKFNPFSTLLQPSRYSLRGAIFSSFDSLKNSKSMIINVEGRNVVVNK